MPAIRLLKLALYLIAVLPLGWVAFGLATGRVVGDEVKFIQHVTGDTALVALFVTLAVTPLRRLTGWNPLIRVRRQIGLTAFGYALLHFLSYVVFDQGASLELIAEDIAEHPWVLVGVSAFALLIPLAVTSTKGWVRRLGGRRWQRLHQLIYPAAALGVLHYFWLVKKDVQAPLLYAAVLGGIFLVRVLVRRSGRPAVV